MKRKIIMLIMFVNFIYLSGCEVYNNEKLNIVVTTTMLQDLTSIIGGDKVEVLGLMSEGIDPHDYEPSASDVNKLNEASIIVYNGFHLEGKMDSVFENLINLEKDIICIEDGLDIELITVDNEVDPHIWFDVNNWILASKYVTSRLCEIDQENKQYYSSNNLNYINELELLDYYIKNRVIEIEEEQRYLVTAHDAFNYFGKAYGFNVMGIQGISTSDEASTADISNMAKLITNQKIKTIFVESSISSKNIDSLIDAVSALGFTTNKSTTELYSDSLGSSLLGKSTYISAFKSNIDAIVDGLK